MTTPGDLDRRDDPALAALASLPGHDLPRSAVEERRARCHAALAASRPARRAAVWRRRYDRVLEPAAVALLGAAALAATLACAVTILSGGAT